MSKDKKPKKVCTSPKGKYRLYQFFTFGLIFLIAVAISGGFDNQGNWHLQSAISPSGWIFKQLNNIAEIFTGLFLLYVGHRVINHFRTHDFISECHDPLKLRALVMTCTWILAIAYVVGNALR